MLNCSETHNSCVSMVPLTCDVTLASEAQMKGPFSYLPLTGCLWILISDIQIGPFCYFVAGLYQALEEFV